MTDEEDVGEGKKELERANTNIPDRRRNVLDFLFTCNSHPGQYWNAVTGAPEGR